MADKRIDVSFREDLALGSKLFQVYASDLDEPSNFGKITFHLENEASYYRIDSETGEVYLQAGFDYETTKSDEVSIQLFLVWEVHHDSTVKTPWENIAQKCNRS